MAEVKLRALVLREVDFGDWDRYLTVLAEDGRRVEILCKNARRGKKTNPAARQLCFSEFILAERGEKYALREADLVHSFFVLAEDIERYALACYLCELTSALSDPGLESPALCRLLLTALLALERKKRDPALVKAAFELRVMAESGYAPDLQACSICGEAVTAGPVWFSSRRAVLPMKAAPGVWAAVCLSTAVRCARWCMCSRPSQSALRPSPSQGLLRGSLPPSLSST